MAAYFETGFSVRKPMWHQLGTVTDEYPEDWQAARKLAGLEWEPIAVPVFATLPDGRRIELPNHRATVRDDTWAPLGVVSDEHELVTHARMGQILEAILGQPGIKFETGGSLRDGRDVWALVYLDEPYRVAGDDSDTLPFLGLLNNHSGEGSCSAIPTDVRIVCWNTYRSSLAKDARRSLGYTFRHTAGVNDQIEDAKNALAGLRNEVSEWKALAADLFGLPVDDEGLTRFLTEYLPDPVVDPDVEAATLERRKANVDKARRIFKFLYLDSVTTNAHRGTALGLVDAAVEYADHVRPGGNSGSRLARSLLRNDPAKARAIEVARRVAR